LTGFQNQDFAREEKGGQRAVKGITGKEGMAFAYMEFANLLG